MKSQGLKFLCISLDWLGIGLWTGSFSRVCGSKYFLQRFGGTLNWHINWHIKCHLQWLHFQIGMPAVAVIVVVVVSRGWCRVLVVFPGLHLLNRRRVDDCHRHHNIFREPPLHLPVLLTQGTPMQAAVHHACVTRGVLRYPMTIHWEQKFKPQRTRIQHISFKSCVDIRVLSFKILGYQLWSSVKHYFRKLSPKFVDSP